MEKLHLNEQERGEISQLVDDVLHDSQSWEPVRFADQASTVAELLPVRLRQFLTRVRSVEAEVTVVSGLPLSKDLAPTPTGWEMAARTTAGQRNCC